MQLPEKGSVIFCLQGEAESQSSWELLLYHIIALGKRLYLCLSSNPPATLPSPECADTSLLFIKCSGNAGGSTIPKLNPQSFAGKVQKKGSASGQAEKLFSQGPVATAWAQNALNCSSRDIPGSLTASLCDGRKGKLCHNFADVQDFIHTINYMCTLLPCIRPRTQPLGDSISLSSCSWEYQCTETRS